MGMVVSDRGDAVELVVTGAWTDEAASAVGQGGVDRLVLNYALGFNEPSLAFLEGLPIRDLVILDPRLTELEPIYSLASTLRLLHLTVNPALKLDLGRISRVQEVGAAWSQVSASIDSVADLRMAFLRAYQPLDLTPLSALSNLGGLVMKDRPRLKALTGLAALASLRRLEIFQAKDLVDVEELAGGHGLEELVLQSCRKVSQIDALAGCTALRRLNLSECGDLPSLEPLRALPDVERLSLFGSTRILDNDLRPIAALPRLRELRMQSRQPYRPSVEAIQDSLRQK